MKTNTESEKPKTSRIESFEIDIPQLNRARTVWIYLPPNYDPSGDPMPVIYMQDGQNLFYDKLSAYGISWHVNKNLDRIFAEIGRSAIVVGVECNDRRRLSEYSPWRAGIFAFKVQKMAKGYNRGGEGKKYAEFFAKNLKPTIDSRYNTDKERHATAVLGSSMGGLISCYLGLKYQRIYETMGLFSTYTPFNQLAFDWFLHETPQTLPQHAVVYCGGKEGLEATSDKQMMNCSVKLYKQLSKRGISTELMLDSEMVHNETSWDVYFSKFAVEFLQRYYQDK